MKSTPLSFAQELVRGKTSQDLLSEKPFLGEFLFEALLHRISVLPYQGNPWEEKDTDSPRRKPRSMPPPPVERMMAEVDGTVTPLAQARLPLHDHGFLFGDSVYETVRTYGGKLFHLEDHLKRLHRSADGLNLRIPWSDNELQRRLDSFRTHLEGEEHYLRLIITRGSGELRYLATGQEPRLVLMGGPLPPPDPALEQGLTAAVVSVKRSHAVDPRMKTGNLLNARMAALEARQRGAQEAILLNHRGELTEGATSNLFLVLEGKVLATPSIDSGILDGITRSVHLKLAAELGLTIREERLPAALLTEAREAFLSSSSRPVAPLRKIDGRALEPVPGPLTVRLRESFQAYSGGL
jgi:branched-chain amino acid aminotransferase